MRQNRNRSQPPSRPLSARMEELAMPKQLNDERLPDKPSVYWVDYIEDPTPHRIKNAQELYQYYNLHWFSPYPNIIKLAEPKRRWRADEDMDKSRPKTSDGADRRPRSAKPKNNRLAETKSVPVLKDRSNSRPRPRYHEQRNTPQVRESRQDVGKTA